MCGDVFRIEGQAESTCLSHCTEEKPSESVDAILLASGFSRRFGKNKLVQEFCGMALAEHTLSLVCGIPAFDNIFFVCAEEDVRRLAVPFLGERSSFRLKILHNERPNRGACESIRLGTAASNARHYMFFMCDQPFLDERTVAQLLSHRKEGRIVVPTWESTQGSPAVFSASFRTQLLGLQDGEHPRSIKKQNPQSVFPLSVHHPRVLADADTPEELQQLSL